MMFAPKEASSMRVALVGRIALALQPKMNLGGVATSTANLLGELKRFDDLELHVVTLTSDVRRPFHVDRDGVSFHHLPAPARFSTVTLLSGARRSLKAFLGELAPDLIHALEVGSGYICLKSVPEIPTVVSIHGIMAQERKHLTSRKERFRATLAAHLIERYCIQNTKYLVEPTRYPEDYFGQLISGKAFATGNAIADSFFDLESDPEPGRLLYCGVIIPRKRVLDLIRAVAQIRRVVPNVVLRLVGSAADSTYFSAVKHAIAREGVASNVVLLGALTGDQLLEEYRRCAMLVLASGEEASPMVIGEMMAVGKPIVATRVGGVPYLVKDGETGFIVDVGDVTALSDRIVRILQNAELRSRMSRVAKQRAEPFRGRAVAEKVHAVYLEAISAT
jgi:glycosyltransferase involved in cell wall biosynthesis